MRRQRREAAAGRRRAPRCIGAMPARRQRRVMAPGTRIVRIGQEAMRSRRHAPDGRGRGIAGAAA
ncbi:hypothetical protein DF052_09385 [Burkholderia glumae]|nr:hypothetical protein NCPPB3923_21010 [Burkholderia glumae]PNL05321.1 hypothetical protein CEQ24_005215 [Burkholderia glumae]RQZ74186.1 hypothetical protein DF052_09385 [Burkholderia glumae]UVS93985.1 hypothetical protein EFP17_31170 [Burkholderia glumae]UVS99534.1 hypothetical protein EFP19_28720 [Burkholderia glumae]